MNIDTLKGIGPKTKELLAKLQIYTIEDLVNHYPFRYEVIRRSNLDELKDGEYTSKPVKSQYGYHIIYRVSAEDKPSLEDSKEEILSKDDVFKSFNNELFNKIIEIEREKAKNKLDEVLNSPKKIDSKKVLNEHIFNGLNFIDSKFISINGRRTICAILSPGKIISGWELSLCIATIYSPR